MWIAFESRADRRFSRATPHLEPGALSEGEIARLLDRSERLVSFGGVTSASTRSG